MEARLQEADRVLCVVSAEYLIKEYSGWERRAAHWAAASKRPNFMLLVLIEDCEVPIALAHIKRCNLFGLGVDDARARLTAYLAEPGPPSGPVPFPGRPKEDTPLGRTDIPFPGDRLALSNIAISVPRHFLGREDAIAEIDAALKRERGVAITTLHGLRGVGKTVLAAAYAERHRADYRATWWIRAETSDTMRADLVSLGVRLGWVAADEKEEPALQTVRERLREEGEGLLLIYDNAIDAEGVRTFSADRRSGPRAHYVELARLAGARHARRNPRLAEGGRGRFPRCPRWASSRAFRCRGVIGGARRPAARSRAGRGILRAARRVLRRISQALRGGTFAGTRHGQRCISRVSRRPNSSEDVRPRHRGGRQVASRGRTV